VSAKRRTPRIVGRARSADAVCYLTIRDYWAPEVNRSVKMELYVSPPKPAEPDALDAEPSVKEKAKYLAG